MDHLSHPAKSDDVRMVLVADNQYHSDLTEDNADQMLFKWQLSFQIKNKFELSGPAMFPCFFFSDDHTFALQKKEFLVNFIAAVSKRLPSKKQ